MTKTLKKIEESASTIHNKINKKQKPSMEFPIRSLSNVKYTPKRGFLELIGQKKSRTLTVNTVKTFAQTLRVMSLSKELIEKEIKLALQECGRHVSTFIKRKKRAAEEFKKKSYIKKYIPHIGIALKEILDLNDKQEQKIINNLTDVLERSRS